MHMKKRAVLLANLGSPEHATTEAVRTYLDQFLMDRHVIQLPWLLRRLIVSLFVLPKRPAASAEAYQSVWTESGSPLISLSEDLREALQQQVDIPVAMAMRYGQPSIEAEILKLVETQQVEEIIYLPLYPHYADSTVTTSIEAAQNVIKKHQLTVSLKVIAPFYDNEDYINALVNSATPFLDKAYDHIIFSYHGLPESHITKLDASKAHCLQKTNCCDAPHAAHKTCYRHQVFATTKAFVEKTLLDETKYSVTFQSRLGRAKWLSPSTEDKIKALAASGAKNILVICPAFVTDCLETLEEIAIQGQETFTAGGGENLTLIPCLNAHPDWVDTLAKWVSET
jgi:ferrochelatase